MKKVFLLIILTVFFAVGCGEDKKVVVNDGENNNTDQDTGDNQDEVDNDVTDETSDAKVDETQDSQNDLDQSDEELDQSDESEVSDESSDEVADEVADETTDETTDETADEVSDADASDCLGVGETTGVYPGAKDCCEGLQTSSTFDLIYTDKIGQCQELVGGVVCIDCGNKVCEDGEDICNCPADCTEPRDERCDDGSTDMCDMVPPVDCEGSDILAIINSCWSCVDPLSCKETDRQAHCDDGTIPTCKMPAPECKKGEVLAYVNNCYKCLDEKTCK